MITNWNSLDRDPAPERRWAALRHIIQMVRRYRYLNPRRRG